MTDDSFAYAAPEDPEVEVFDLSDIAERAIKTGVEVGIVGLPILHIADVDQATLLAAAIAAGCAAASVVLTAVLQWSRAKKSRVQV
jgi:hypothetical protein